MIHRLLPQFCFGAGLLLSACVSSHQAKSPPNNVTQMAAKASPTCWAQTDCPSSLTDPYLCTARSEQQRLIARGDSQCEAQQKLFQIACRMKLERDAVHQLHCVPDPSQGECPVARKVCTYEYRPTTCRARTYEGRNLSWKLQPTARGSNECQARQSLQLEACYLGLVPSHMNDIACEADRTGGECPPKIFCPDDLDKNPQRCQVTSYAGTTLDPPWVVFAPNRCEARYQLQQLACRYATEANGLRPSQLGDIHCEEQPADTE
jgi:hypothetical protein